MAVANPEVEFHLDGFLKQCEEILNEHYNQPKWSSLQAPDIKVYPGGKYYKVAKKDKSHNESVWFFVTIGRAPLPTIISWKGSVCIGPLKALISVIVNHFTMRGLPNTLTP